MKRQHTSMRVRSYFLNPIDARKQYIGRNLGSEQCFLNEADKTN